MDTQRDIREFLTTRRARLTPVQAGLPDFGGRRRVPGLRREEVALLAGMSVEYYVRFERGNAIGVSERSSSTTPSARISTTSCERRTRAGGLSSVGGHRGRSSCGPGCSSCSTR